MNSKVKVTADAAGNVIVQSVNNPEFGYIRVEQEKVLFSDSGFMERKVISALVHGQLKDLSFLKSFQTKSSTPSGGSINKFLSS